MDYWYLLGTYTPECSLPSLCECQQRWGCSYMGYLFKKMCYMSQWPHTCDNMCKVGWRRCNIYRVISSFFFTQYLWGLFGFLSSIEMGLELCKSEYYIILLYIKLSTRENIANSSLQKTYLLLWNSKYLLLRYWLLHVENPVCILIHRKIDPPRANSPSKK